MNKHIDEVIAEFDEKFCEGTKIRYDLDAFEIKDFLTTALTEQERRIKEDMTKLTLTISKPPLHDPQILEEGRDYTLNGRTITLLTPLPSSNE